MIQNLFAGTPYTVAVSNPILDSRYYVTLDLHLERVRYLGTDGRFDGHFTIHRYQWMTGALKGQIHQNYSVNFWRKPTQREKLDIWNDLNEWEKAKLIAGQYAGLKLENFIPVA